MKIYHVISLSIILMLAVSCSSQKKDVDRVGTAEWLVNQYFVNPNPPDLREYYTGEMMKLLNDPPYGATVPLEVKTRYRTIQQDSSSSIWGITSTYGEDTRDMYCYMRRGPKAWQIEAITWLPAYDVFLEQIGQLKAMPEQTDSIKAEIRTKELTIATDSSLESYFQGYHAGFDSLAALTNKYTGLQMYNTRCGDPTFVTEHDSLYSKVCPFMGQLNVKAIYHGAESCPNGSFFEIGSYIRSSVGFLYVPEGSKPPAMSYKRFIYVGKIAENWYLYKSN